MDRQKLLDGGASDGALRMIFRIAEHVEHHHAVGHGGENRTEAVFAVEPLAHPGHRAVEGALPRGFGKKRLGGAQNIVDTAEEPEPRRLLLRRFRRRADGVRRREKKLVDAHAL